MSIQGEYPIDDFVSGRWADDEPAIRLQAVHSLGKSGPQSQPLLARLAMEDDDAEVRAAAVSYLNEPDLLHPLREQPSPIQEAAILQYHKILAGSIASSIGHEEQLEQIRNLDNKSVKQVALLAKSKLPGVAALSRLTDSQDLSDVTLFAASVHVRKAAAARLSDPELISDLLDRLANKDKSVAKVLAEQLMAVAEKPADEPAKENQGVEEPAAVSITAEEMDAVKARAEALTEAVRQLATELANVGARNTAKLNAFVNSHRNLMQQIRWPKSIPVEGIFAELKAMQIRITELLDLNRQYQQEQVVAAPLTLETLKQSLESGQSAEAIQAWDKLQGLLGNLGGKLAKDLRKQLNEHRARINELKDWKNFAGTEKKKELIQHMQHLLEAKMNPPDRARQVNTLHQEWKALGRTSQNEKLWREFKKISDTVYEPCKEFFRQQKQAMAENFRQRNEICTQLETYLQQLDREHIMVTDLTRIEDQAKADWKRFAPVEQSKIKKLQKRFYSLMAELRAIRRSSQTQNTQQKQALLEKARQVVQLEDNRQAMNDAKALQAQWKLVGPGSFKEDRKLWEEFRAACDIVFQKRDEQKREFKDVVGKSVAEARRLLAELEALHTLDESAFSEARKQFSDLQRDFRQALDSRVKKERQELLNLFNDSVRKIDARFKRLPDRKVLQLRNSLAQRAEYCARLESQLLACSDDAAIANVLSQLDPAEWEALPLSGNSAYDSAIESRFNTLRTATTLNAINSLADDCTDEARNLCVSLEIRANVNSPSGDQALRLQIQLSQLQSGFGKGLHSNEDNLKFARDMELRFLCLGPIEASMRENLAQRVTNAVNRIG